MSHNLCTNRILSAVVFILLGIVLLLFPNATMILVCRIIGWGVLISGIAALIGAIRDNNGGAGIAAGVVGMIVGIYIIARPDVLASIIPFVVGIVMVVNGIMNMTTAARNKDVFGHRYLPSLVGGILTVLFGVLLLCNSFYAASLIVRFIGLGLILGSVSNLISMNK